MKVSLFLCLCCWACLVWSQSEIYNVKIEPKAFEIKVKFQIKQNLNQILDFPFDCHVMQLVNSQAEQIQCGKFILSSDNVAKYQHDEDYIDNLCSESKFEETFRYNSTKIFEFLWKDLRHSSEYKMWIRSVATKVNNSFSIKTTEPWPLIKINSVKQNSFTIQPNFPKEFYQNVVKVTVNDDDKSLGKVNRTINIKNSSFVEINGLDCYSRYLLSWRCQYKDEWCSNNQSSFLEITTAESIPSEPRQLEFSSLTNTSVDLNWNSPEQMNGKLKEYVISCHSRFPIRESTNKKKISLKNLYPATAYKCTVRTVNGAGESKQSQSITFSTKHGQSESISDFHFKLLRNEKLFLSWKPPVNSHGEIKCYYGILYKVGKNESNEDKICADHFYIEEMTNTNENFASLRIEELKCQRIKLKQIHAIRFENSSDISIFLPVDLHQWNYLVNIYPINQAGLGLIYEYPPNLLNNASFQLNNPFYWSLSINILFILYGILFFIVCFIKRKCQNLKNAKGNVTVYGRVGSQDQQDNNNYSDVDEDDDEDGDEDDEDEDEDDDAYSVVDHHHN